MASWYVWSGATGTGDGSSWANAFTSIAAAQTSVGATGDDFYVAHDHAESYATNQTIQPSGTAGAWRHIYCVNRAGSVPPVTADLRATATITTTGATNLYIGGNWVYWYGIGFSCGSGANATTLTVSGDGESTYDSCTFSMPGTAFASVARVGGDSTGTKLINCQWTNFGHPNNVVALQGGRVTIDGPSTTPIYSGTTVPFFLFGPGSSLSARGNIVRNADLTSLTAQAVYDLKGASSPPSVVLNCKLPSGSPFQASGGFNASSSQLRVIGCNTSGSNVERNEIYQLNCYLTTELVLVRANGATDGTTSYSWKLAPQNSASNHDNALETFEGAIWNDAVGSSKTLTVHLLTDGLTLTTDDIWLEVDYLGSPTSPLATRLTSETAKLGTASNLPTNTQVWTTTGMSSPTKQYLSLTFTPQMAGLVRWRVKYAKSGSNTNICYVCPKADLS